MEVLVILLLVAASSLAPIVLEAKSFRRGVIVAAGSALAITIVAAFFLGRRNEERAASHATLLGAVPRQEREEFISSKTCRACHPGHYASWHRTYHRTMTQLATPQSVVGEFDGRQLTLRGRKYRPRRRGDEFWVEMPDPRWLWQVQTRRGDTTGLQPPRQVERQVVMTTGSHHMQVYWVEAKPAATARGKSNALISFPFTYIFEDNTWVPNEDTFLKPPGYGQLEIWNRACIRCHSVAGQPGLDANAPGRMDSRVAELGIACESCHGPAAEHVRVNRNPQRRYGYHLSGEVDPTIVNPEKLSHEKSAEICGQCHGIQQFKDGEAWSHGDGIRYRAGGDLDALRVVVRHPENVTGPEMTAYMADYRKRFPTALDGQFWRDGMVRVSGREYNGLIESGCFQRGELSCLSCHSMHDSDPDDQLRRDNVGNEICLSCHPSYRDDLTGHTFHAPESSGSQCYNCHMPHTTYGLMKAIRNHEIDSPSVAIDKQSGRPNACNLCHLDRPLSWTQEHLNEWYGTEQVQLTQEEQRIAASVLWILRGDAGQRALAAWHMGWKPALDASGRDWLAPFLTFALGDPYATVRFLARRSLNRQSGFEDFRFDYVAPESQRKIAVEEALARWERLRRARDEPLDRFGTHLLVDRQGNPHQQGIATLLRQRDQRVVELRE